MLWSIVTSSQGVTRRVCGWRGPISGVSTSCNRPPPSPPVAQASPPGHRRPHARLQADAAVHPGQVLRGRRRQRGGDCEHGGPPPRATGPRRGGAKGPALCRRVCAGPGRGGGGSIVRKSQALRVILGGGGCPLPRSTPGECVHSGRGGGLWIRGHSMIGTGLTFRCIYTEFKTVKRAPQTHTTYYSSVLIEPATAKAATRKPNRDLTPRGRATSARLACGNTGTLAAERSRGRRHTGGHTAQRRATLA